MEIIETPDFQWKRTFHYIPGTRFLLSSFKQERENLNIQIVRAINSASEAWGIQSMRWWHDLFDHHGLSWVVCGCQLFDRYEIRDIRLPERIQEAMQMQVSCDYHIIDINFNISVIVGITDVNITNIMSLLHELGYWPKAFHIHGLAMYTGGGWA